MAAKKRRVGDGSNRSDLRKERYRYLRSLGFSSADARKYRDQSFENLQTYVDTTVEQVEQTPSRKRTEREREIVKNVRKERAKKRTVESSTRMLTRTDRYENFVAWTVAKDFPNWAMQYIAAVNRQAGFGPVNSYGFRRFFYRYVENRPEATAATLADRDDS